MRDSMLRLAAVLTIAAALSPLGLPAQAPAGPPDALTAPPGAGTDDATYAQALTLLDTLLVRPDRAARLQAMRPGFFELEKLLAAVAQDGRAPVYARGNALMMLANGGNRRLDVYAAALEDTAVEVRAAAAVGLGRLLTERYDPRVLAVLRRTLSDEATDVRVRGIEAIADHDPRMLEAFLAGSPEEPVASIARSMVALAEQRGAPSAVGDAALGPLTKVGLDGTRLVYEPVEVLPEARATVGTLRAELPGGEAIELGDRVEVVKGVVPAFVVPTEGAIVFESGREIFVYDLEARELASRGPGIAPRPYPLRPSLVFFRAVSSGPQPRPDVAKLRYDVVEAPLGGGEPRTLGTFDVEARQAVHGGYSPVRWIRVRETRQGFVLQTDDGEKFPLPDPFDLPGS
jgi:hypothetical protein